MMKSTIFVALVLALFGVLVEGYVSSGYGGCGTFNGGIGYGTGYGTGYGAGYGAGFGNGACAPASTVCDTCQCVKTVVRPVVEQIPYTCSRRVRAPRFRATPVFAGPAVSTFTGPGIIESGPGIIESGPGLIEARTGFIEGRPYLNGRYGGYGNNILV